ncbi:MAG: Fic family protein [Clostridiales Family XIII bacterium]|jgi:fido (protein-threonine AMPylation protein)/biotin operon repressor|nr:Fic family protein [Clostridiales Family XIII bacterium]
MTKQKKPDRNASVLTAAELEEYIVQGEPEQREKSYYWKTAIGLQAVDGIKPSDYLIATANENICGAITLDEAQERIESYYKARAAAPDEGRAEEADKVSARITAILAEKTFSFTPVEYISIHRQLFDGIYSFAGKIRDYNITKDEWVLHGATVYYTSAQNIKETMDYDFAQEKAFSYKSLTTPETAEHIAKFISGLWQIHAFGEGNTRTAAVFTIKYLRSFGFDATNDIFATNAWYFRNALVRANYNDISKGIHATQEYLNRFFGNLIFGESNNLSNRELLVGVNVGEKIAYVRENVGENTIYVGGKSADVGENVGEKTVDVGGKSADVGENVGEKTIDVGGNVGEKSADVGENIEEKSDIKSSILAKLKAQPELTAKDLAVLLGKTSRTIERHIKELRELGLLVRIGADKGGRWEVR